MTGPQKAGRGGIKFTRPSGQFSTTARIRAPQILSFPWRISPKPKKTEVVLPMHFGQKPRRKDQNLERSGRGRCVVDIIRRSIALNGSFFTTPRKIQQYVQKPIFDLNALHD